MSLFFLYPPNTSKNQIFWCFQGVKKGTRNMKWVRMNIVLNMFKVNNWHRAGVFTVTFEHILENIWHMTHRFLFIFLYSYYNSYEVFIWWERYNKTILLSILKTGYHRVWATTIGLVRHLLQRYTIAGSSFSFNWLFRKRLYRPTFKVVFENNYLYVL